MSTSIHTEAPAVTITAQVEPATPSREPLDLIPAVCEFCGDDSIMVHRKRVPGAKAACLPCAKGIALGKSGTILRRPEKRVAGSAVQLGQMSDAQIGQALRHSAEQAMAEQTVVGRARALRRTWRGLVASKEALTQEQTARVVLPAIPEDKGNRLPAVPALDAGALGLDEEASPALVDPYRHYCERRGGTVPPSLTGFVTNRQVVALHLLLTEV